MNVTELIAKLTEIAKAQDSCCATNVRNINVNSGCFREIILDTTGQRSFAEDLKHAEEALEEVEDDIRVLQDEVASLEDELRASDKALAEMREQLRHALSHKEVQS